MKKLKPSSFRRGDEVKQLRLTYHGGPLAPVSSDRTEKLRVGDRAPDAAVTTAAGMSTRLYEILCGPHFTAIAYGPDAAQALDHLDWPHTGAQLTRLTVGASSDRADLVLIDSGHIFENIYGLTGDTLLLIRPDGYLGHIATSDYLESIRTAARSLTPIGARV